MKVVALCDPDTARTAAAAKDLPGVKQYTDMRKLLEDKDIDAVTIATCNHWHCLAAIWACEAGKDVYCEKPLSHRLWEGRQLIAAAQEERPHRRGRHAAAVRSRCRPRSRTSFTTRRRSARSSRSSSRAAACAQTIGKRDTPLDPPKTVDYNLWLGPAQDEPIFRDKFHYDWHWAWNTGDGECGNWGVHMLDDVVNVVFRDKHKLPPKAAGGGGRVVWNDAGESPNFHMAYLEAGGTPVLFCPQQPARDARHDQRL